MVELFKVMDLPAMFVAVNEVRLKSPVIVAAVLSRTMDPWVDAFVAVSEVAPPLPARVIVPAPEKTFADIVLLMVIVPLFTAFPLIAADVNVMEVPLLIWIFL